MYDMYALYDMYEILEDSEFVIRIKPGILETALGVLYTYEEINELTMNYIGGDISYGHNNLYYNIYFKVDNIVNYVENELKNNKIVNILSEYSDNLFESRHKFWEYGITYSKVKGGFMNYRQPNKKTKIDNNALKTLRLYTIYQIEDYLSNNNIQIKIQNKTSKINQTNIIKMVNKIGFTYEDVMKRPSISSVLNKTTSPIKYEELFKKWFENCLK